MGMNVLNLTDARCEALFASALQRSDDPTAEAVSEAIRDTVREAHRRGDWRPEPGQAAGS